MRKYVVLLAALICIVGCGRNVEKQYGTGFSLVAGDSGYTYSVWINDEPVDWGYAQNTAILYDFPLRTGSNDLTVKMEILPPPAKPPVALTLIALASDVSGREPTKEGDWTRIDGFDLFRPFSKKEYEWESEFDLKSPVERTSKDFDLLSDNKESFTRRAQLLAIEFAAKLRDGNEAEWSRIWGPGANKLFGFRSAALGTNGVAKSITEASNVVIESGKYLIMAHAKSGALVQFFDDNKVLQYGYFNFIFAQSGGKWCVFGANRRWWKLPDELQHF